MGFVQQLPEIIQRAESWVNGLIIRNIITVVHLWRRIDRVQPDNCGTQIVNIIQMTDNSLKIADTITVCIIKATGINLVNNPCLPPRGCILHGPQYSTGQTKSKSVREWQILQNPMDTYSDTLVQMVLQYLLRFLYYLSADIQKV